MHGYTLILLVLVAKAAGVTSEGFEVSKTDGLIQVSLNGDLWFEEQNGITDIFMQKDDTVFSNSSGTLSLVNESQINGSDVLGSFTGKEMTWSPLENFFFTSYRTYVTQDGGIADVIVFKQEFRNQDQDIEGTSLRDLPKSRALNEISSSYPSLAINSDEGPEGFWSFGGRMAGTPCISIGPLTPDTNTIRGGNYGGVLVLFDRSGDRVVILSPLQNFLVTNMRHRVSSNINALDFGLLGSVQRLERPGIVLETVIVFGESFDDAFDRWGQVLRAYNGGKPQIQEDLISEYLSYWTDNGGFYYYNPMPGLDFEKTFVKLSQEFSAMEIPVQFAEIDSWFYPKDIFDAVKDWSPREDVFPSGLVSLQEQTGFRIIAHNRFWSRFNVYDVNNGGKYEFIREIFSIPQDESFWVDLFQNATEWDLVLYFQDWQDFQYVFMSETLTDTDVAATWLRQMALGASRAGIQIQYCMTLPKELLQSVEADSVTRIRVSEDYLLIEHNWRIGLTSHVTHALGVRPFKDVFWTSSRNPGNNFYYDCMEIGLEVDNAPWPLNYRYVGKLNVTDTGKTCLYWHDLGLSFEFPFDGLVENYCRNSVNLLVGNGRPMCFVERTDCDNYREWTWENCDVPVCDRNCTRDTSAVNETLPYCEEFIEPNPDLQAAVSVLSTAGVGFGDAIENINKDVLARTCRMEDGKILSVDKPARAAPVQILEMAFGGRANPADPTSSYGEIWSSQVTLDDWTFGVLLVAENKITRMVTTSDLGLSLAPSPQLYLVHAFYDNQTFNVIDSATASELLPEQQQQQFDLFYFSPLWSSADETIKVALLGESDKYVPFSRSRFRLVSFESNVLRLETSGVVDVRVAFVYSDSVEILTMSCAVEGGDVAVYSVDALARSYTCNEEDENLGNKVAASGLLMMALLALTY